MYIDGNNVILEKTEEKVVHKLKINNNNKHLFILLKGKDGIGKIDNATYEYAIVNLTNADTYGLKYNKTLKEYMVVKLKCKSYDIEFVEQFAHNTPCYIREIRGVDISSFKEEQNIKNIDTSKEEKTEENATNKQIENINPGDKNEENNKIRKENIDTKNTGNEKKDNNLENSFDKFNNKNTPDTGDITKQSKITKALTPEEIKKRLQEVSLF